MPSAGITITGIKEVQELLANAPKNIVMLGYGRALNAGINVFAGALVSRTPVVKGDLVRALVIDVTVDSDGKGGTAAVGFGKQGNVANWLEYGHHMVTHAPGKKAVGEVPAHPFMRPTFDAAADAALDAFCESLSSTLKQEY